MPASKQLLKDTKQLDYMVKKSQKYFSRKLND